MKVNPTRIALDPTGWAADAVGLAAGLKYGVKHPVELGQAIVDWETWATNPGRALGRLAPDAVITVATGGAGAAARGATTTRRTIADALESSPPVKHALEASSLDGATRLGQTVSPLGRTYENADTYLGDVAKHYGINLRAVSAVWDHSLSPGVKGLTRQVEGGWMIRINPGFVDEVDLANTIAHELSHARDFQKGLSSLEGPAYESGDALEEWIYGLR